jgi:hypothetical protein
LKPTTTGSPLFRFSTNNWPNGVFTSLTLVASAVEDDVEAAVVEAV